MFTSKLNFVLLCFMYSQMLPRSFGQTDSDWTYEDPESWAKMYPSCGGSKQSPVNINTKKMKRSLAQPMEMKDYDKTPSSMTVTNNGHSVTLTADWGDEESPYIVGGHQINSFSFDRIDFHWGPGCKNGSEHTVDGYGRCLEIQFVHWNRDAKSMEKSATYKNGRAIVTMFGVPYQGNQTTEKALNALSSALTEVTEPGSSTQVTPFPLSDFGWVLLRGYQTYQGSMTTPPCEEVVMWLFPERALYFVGYDLLGIFRSIKLNGGTDNNVRPVQPLGDRVIEDY